MVRRQTPNLTRKEQYLPWVSCLNFALAGFFINHYYSVGSFPLEIIFGNYLKRDLSVKYFFYIFFLVASLGAVASVTNPAIVQQGAAFFGLELLLDSDEPSEKLSSEDHLANFFEMYPTPENRLEQKTNGGRDWEQHPLSTAPTDVMPSIHSATPMLVVEETFPPAFPPVYDDRSWDQDVRLEQTSLWEQPTNDWEHPQNARQQPPPFNLQTEDWSGPAQQLEPIPARTTQQSVYAAPASHDSGAPFGFPLHHQRHPPVGQHEFPHTESTHSIPPAHPMPHPPAYPPAHPMAPAMGAESFPVPFQTHQQSVQHQAVPPTPNIESVPVYGTEMVARVGTQVILLGDVLPKLRRLALQIVNEKIKEMPDEERNKIPPKEIEEFVRAFIANHYPAVLEEQIQFALVYNDYDTTQSAAEKNYFDMKIGEEFDRTEIPAMIEEFNLENTVALRRYLEMQFGSSLEKERRLWVREQIVKEWIRISMQRATMDCTHYEMEEFYRANLSMFTSAPRARWQEMVVLLSNHNTEQEAWNKISWMGNQVAKGAAFEMIAKANSEGFTASSGGTWDWTGKGSLTSAELEQAIFTQPVGHLSQSIIRSNRGLHLIRVLEREEETVVSFIEAQSDIRNKIRNQRAQRYQNEYFAELNQRFPTHILHERIDSNIGLPQTASIR